MKTASELIYRLSLFQCQGIGAVAYKKLIQGHQSAKAVFEKQWDWAQAKQYQLSSKAMNSLMKGPDFDSAFQLFKRCQDIAVRLVEQEDPSYPSTLRNIHNPPPFLFVKGIWPLPSQRRIAVVGTRNPSAYGLVVCERLCPDFSYQGYSVVSGLALGIDAAAHWHCLQSGGHTIAVLGCGVDLALPMENRLIYKRMESHGTLISEFAPGTPAEAINFPRRNRIISALSNAVLIVEAGKKSGALITADYAKKQGIPLYAIPGPITHPKSEGCNLLIAKGVPMALHSNFLAGGYSSSAIPRSRLTMRSGLKLNEGEKKICKMLSTEKSLDQICGLSGGAPQALLPILLRLEVSGVIQKMPGSKYILKGENEI